jgi:hypothetical protein
MRIERDNLAIKNIKWLKNQPLYLTIINDFINVFVFLKNEVLIYKLFSVIF